MNQLKFNFSLTNVRTVSDNSTSAATEVCRQFEADRSTVKFVKILVYSVLLVISLFGNVVIITTVVRNKRMRATTNYLIANMAVSDLLISTCGVPNQLTEIVGSTRRWLIDGIVGLISCKLVYFFQDISFAVSVQSLVVIAIDRYRGVVFLFRPAIITPKRCKVIISLVAFIDGPPRYIFL